MLLVHLLVFLSVLLESTAGSETLSITDRASGLQNRAYRSAWRLYFSHLPGKIRRKVLPKVVFVFFTKQ